MQGNLGNIRAQGRVRDFIHVWLVRKVVERSQMKRQKFDLIEAVRECKTKRVVKLLKDGADVNLTDDHGFTALYYALAFYWQVTPLIKALFSSGAAWTHCCEIIWRCRCIHCDLVGTINYPCVKYIKLQKTRIGLLSLVAAGRLPRKLMMELSKYF